MSSERFLLRSAVLVLAILGIGCGAASLRPFPLREPLWQDPDQTPFLPKPEEYWSSLIWDGADQSAFRPITRFFAVDPGGKAVNVNALDEVPNSSWFTNRIGRNPVTPQELAQGACDKPPLDPAGPWIVSGGKPNGDNPGFIIKDGGGQKYLLKFDGTLQAERATTADVVGALLYHAAGYYVPCNRVVYFHEGIFKVGEDVTVEAADGSEEPLTWKHIELALSKGTRLPDGRYRASASMFLEGKPLGPWRYQGTWSEDPNDVVRHEDRRDVRGGRVLAAWIHHFDAREQNTLAMWIESGKGGYVRHNIIDFGDSLGSMWDWEGITRRLGHAYYLDFGYLFEDFVTLGTQRRPWEEAQYGPAGAIFGYFGVERFEADAWRPGYPNPAFGRMTEHDGAWMARIIARFGRQHVETVVGEAQLSKELWRSELVRILMGRRDKILERWLMKLSPLSAPKVVIEAGNAKLCVEDLAIASGLRPSSSRMYSARSWDISSWKSTTLQVARSAEALVCTALPTAGGTATKPQYVIVDVLDGTNGRLDDEPVRVHLYHLGGTDFRVVGLERPEASEPPG